MSALQGYENGTLVPLEEALRPLISIVPDIEKMFKVVTEKIMGQLTDDSYFDEVASIMLYTLKSETPESSFSFFLNTALRSQNRAKLLPWFPYIRLFISALSKLPPLASCTVYRGLKINANEGYVKGNTIVWRDFVSCTSTIERTEDFIDENEAQAIFIIECNSAKDISGCAFDENSTEIILYPERQFEIVSSLNYGNQSKLIQLRELVPNSPRIYIPPTTSHAQYQMSRLEYIIEQCPNNRRLDLTNQQLVDEDMKFIVQHVITNKKFQELLLSRNMITSKGSSILTKALRQNTTLTSLSLSYNNLSDKGVQYLAKALTDNNWTLVTLSLHETGITDQSVQYLAEMLKKNTTLTWLYLGRNKISDLSIELLTGALTYHNKTLKALDLSHNELITDASMDHLTNMLETNTSLETLWINNCGISVDERKILQHIVQEHRRFFILFVDNVPDHILKISKDLIMNRGKLPILS